MKTREDERLFDEIAYEVDGENVLFATRERFKQLAEKGVLSETFYKHAMVAATLVQSGFENNAPSKDEVRVARMENEDLVNYVAEDVPSHLGGGTLVFYKSYNRKIDPSLN